MAAVLHFFGVSVTFEAPKFDASHGWLNFSCEDAHRKMRNLCLGVYESKSEEIGGIDDAGGDAMCLSNKNTGAHEWLLFFWLLREMNDGLEEDEEGVRELMTGCLSETTEGH